MTLYGVGAHHQNGIAEIYITTMVEKTRTVLLDAHTKWPTSIKMEFWTFTFSHVVTQWNNLPRQDMDYLTIDEKFNDFNKRQNDAKDHFKLGGAYQDFGYLSILDFPLI